MNLVQFLAAGVNGAASGSATFFLRGTASSAAAVLYNDFEGVAQPGTNVITLDANGAAEVYCDAYVDVEIKNSAGTTLRTVTLGNSAPLVEVRSDSFTGTDYDGDPANTAGEPVTLKAILDKWFDSAGAVNWQVISNGVATNLQSAVAGVAGMFINVKDPTYGATGDGVTDDTTAVLAAISAASSAGGGLVFFPPGTYQVTQLNPSVSDVVLMGAGDEAAIIRGTSTTTFLLRFSDNTANASKRITGLGFTSSSVYDVLVDVEESQTLHVDNCKFTCSNLLEAAIRRIDADGLAKINVSNCIFDDVIGDSAIQNLSDDSESFITVNGCRFVANAAFVGAIVDGPDFSVSQCEFDASAVTLGPYHAVDAGSNETTGKYLGTYTGNTFRDGGSDGFAFMLSGLANGSDFTETANSFYGFVDPVDPDDKGHIYDASTANSASLIGCHVELGSRKGKFLAFIVSGAGTELDAALVAELLVIEFTNASSFTVTFRNPGKSIVGFMPPGCMINVMVLNDSGGAFPVIFNVDSITGPSFTETSVANGGKAYCTGQVALESAGSEFFAVYATNKSST